MADSSVECGSMRLLDPSVELTALAAALWGEREAAEDVIYRLTVERLVLQRAQRWLPRSDDDLRRALTRLAERSADRAAVVGRLADQLGLAESCSLAQIIDSCPEPWPVVLADHRQALRKLVHELLAAGTATRRQLRVAARAVREALADVRTGATGEPADPTVESARAVALEPFRAAERELLVTAAEVAHRTAMATIDDTAVDSLVAFVG